MKTLIDLSHYLEYIARGRRYSFQLLTNAFKGIKQIGLIGWGSQSKQTAYLPIAAADFSVQSA